MLYKAQDMSERKYWWKEAKIYELYVDKFAVDLRGLTKKLDYFNHLGVNTLHILPHYPSPMVDGGYDVMDYLNVRPELGTLEDFDKLIENAHRRKIRIIIDFVLNHVSEHHPWFIEARSSRNAQKREYFLWSETASEYANAENSFPHLKPSNWVRNDETQDYYYATFYPQQPDLNWRNPKVFESMMQHMDFWADRGVDGFRLDATSHLVKHDHLPDGLQATHAILKRIRTHLDKNYGGSVILLAEAHRSIPEVKQFFGNGDECHLAYNFSMTEALFLSLMHKDKRYTEFASEFSRNIPDNCAWAFFLRNHDEISCTTVPAEDRSALLRFLDPDQTYLFRHSSDTAVRLGTIFQHAPERLFEAFELLYSLPGASIMYYGDEIGMENLPVRDGIVDSREYVRGDFDWGKAQQELEDPHSLLNRTSRLIQGTHAPWLVRAVLGKT